MARKYSIECAGTYHEAKTASEAAKLRRTVAEEHPDKIVTMTVTTERRGDPDRVERAYYRFTRDKGFHRIEEDEDS